MAPIKEPTWLFHQEDGKRLFAPGDAHPGEGWSDEPFDRMPDCDPVAAENAALRMVNAELNAEVSRLETENMALRRGRTDGE